jgi:hypothetical protein
MGLVNNQAPYNSKEKRGLEMKTFVIMIIDENGIGLCARIVKAENKNNAFSSFETKYGTIGKYKWIAIEINI